MNAKGLLLALSVAASVVCVPQSGRAQAAKDAAPSHADLAIVDIEADGLRALIAGRSGCVAALQDYRKATDLLLRNGMAVGSRDLGFHDSKGNVNHLPPTKKGYLTLGRAIAKNCL